MIAIALAGALLAACGQPSSQGAVAPTAPPTAAPQPPAPTTAPAATAAPAPPAATVAPQAATAAPSAQADATAAPAPDGPYAGIPRSRTPEGYQLLGDPAAPVTLVMYSDFL